MVNLAVTLKITVLFYVNWFMNSPKVLFISSLSQVLNFIHKSAWGFVRACVGSSDCVNLNEYTCKNNYSPW